MSGKLSYVRPEAQEISVCITSPSLSAPVLILFLRRCIPVFYEGFCREFLLTLVTSDDKKREKSLCSGFSAEFRQLHYSLDGVYCLGTK